MLQQYGEAINVADVDGGGWILVRSLNADKTTTWHPATDSLEGLDEYDDGEGTWSIPFSRWSYDQLLLTYGQSSSGWVIIDRDQLGNVKGSSSGTNRELWRTSASQAGTSTIVVRNDEDTSAGQYDPSVSWKNGPSDADYVYREGSALRSNSNVLKNRGGAHVYVRRRLSSTGVKRVRMEIDSDAEITLVRKNVVCGSNPSSVDEIKIPDQNTIELEECARKCRNEKEGCEYVSYQYSAKRCWLSSATDRSCSNTASISYSNKYHLYYIHSDTISHTIEQWRRRCPTSERVNLGEYRSAKGCAIACESRRGCSRFTFGSSSNSISQCFSESCDVSSLVNDNTFNLYSLTEVVVVDAGATTSDEGIRNTGGWRTMDIETHPSGRIKVFLSGKIVTEAMTHSMLLKGKKNPSSLIGSGHRLRIGSDRLRIDSGRLRLERNRLLIESGRFRVESDGHRVERGRLRIESGRL